MSKRVPYHRLRRFDHGETPERIKRWPGLMRRFPRVRIYSAEHDAYWRGTGQGYTQDKTKSAVLDCEEAFNRVQHCGPEKLIWLIGEGNSDAE